MIHVVEHGDDHDGHLEEADRLLSERGIAATSIKATGNPARSICVAAERDGFWMGLATDLGAFGHGRRPVLGIRP